jgi:hypothetical protein
MSQNSRKVLNPMPNNFPLACVERVSNLRHVALIPFVLLLLSLNQNPHALVSIAIVRVRIHERELTHVAKLAKSVEPNVQHHCSEPVFLDPWTKIDPLVVVSTYPLRNPKNPSTKNQILGDFNPTYFYWENLDFAQISTQVLHPKL